MAKAANSPPTSMPVAVSAHPPGVVGAFVNAPDTPGKG